MIQDARERGPALFFCAMDLGLGDVGGAQVILALGVSGCLVGGIWHLAPWSWRGGSLTWRGVDARLCARHFCGSL